VSPQRKPAYPPLAVWGVFLGVLTAVSVIFFSPDVSTPALLGGNAAFVLVLALLLAVSRRSIQTEGGGADPDASPATVWLALSLALMAVGAVLGLWLVFIGGGMTIVGIAATVRELRAQRAAARQLGDGS
jgi:asparagine N-glycosylation enzyme membrane subunit Stt3